MASWRSPSTVTLEPPSSDTASIHSQIFTRDSQMENPAADERSPLLSRRNQQKSPSSQTSETNFKIDPEYNSLISSGQLEQYYVTHKRKIGCKQLLYNRLPKGRAVYLVYFIYFLESFAFYGALNGVKQLMIGNVSVVTWAYFVFTLINFSTSRLFYPVAGVLADTYLGRYNVIHIGLWLFWSAFAIIALSLALDNLADVSAVITEIILPIIGAVLLSVGAGSVEATAIPFGVDQLRQGAPSDELSSYFYWYYFSRNAGISLNVFVFLALFDTRLYMLPAELRNSDLGKSFNYSVMLTIQSLSAALAITIALITHYCLQNWYYRDRQRENPLKLLVNVLYFAATARRQQPKYRRTFRYGEEKKRRIELAKIDFDGIFTGEEVENVKTFCSIMLVIFSLAGYFVSYGASVGMLSYQLNTTATTILGDQHPFLPSELFILINTGTSLISLPLLNHLILPFAPGSSIRLRLGVGVFMNILSSAAAAFLQWTFNHLAITTIHQLLWLLLPTILLSLGEVLVFVSALEFIYAQSPESMKGLITGLFYFAFGLFNGGGIIFMFQYPLGSTGGMDTILWFYLIFIAVSVIGLLLYAIVVCLYRNRERPTTDDSENEAIRRDIVQSVFSSKYS